MEFSAIEWTDHTINLWHGCDKVKNNPCCDHCYAATHSARFKQDIWGHDRPRIGIRSAFRNLNKWQKAAAAAGVVHKVFAMSMGDLFERDMPLKDPLMVGNDEHTTIETLRSEFFGRIHAGLYPNLVFLALTKRPQNVLRMVPGEWLDKWPRNVWVGTSAGDQANADRLIPHLLKVPAPVRFLSIEPLLEPLDLFGLPHGDHASYNALSGDHRTLDGASLSEFRPLEWIIVGGESGPGARPMHPDWVRSLRDQCAGAGVPFHFKQWGAYAPNCLCGGRVACKAAPRARGPVGVMFRCGKGKAGRTLDGRTHDADPISAETWTPDNSAELATVLQSSL